MAFAETPVAEQGKQPYKFGGKELDRMHGLNWHDFEARFLSNDIPVFPTPDLMARKYPWISPYAWCANNPMNRIDPTGLTDYKINDNGYIRIMKDADGNILGKGDEFDRLFAGEKSIKVNDVKLLSQLAGKEGSAAAKTSNSTDAFNVFKFAVDNSNVEWALSGFKNSKGTTDFIFNTTHDQEDITKRNRFGHERSNLIFDIHSHPGTEDYTRKASGYDLYFNGLTMGGSDADFMNLYFNAAKDANKKWPSEYPKLFIYHKATSVLYNYNHKSPSIYAGKVTTPLSIRSIISQYKIQP
jgi:RHS repeat-associated protein